MRTIRLWLLVVTLGSLAGSFAVMAGVEIHGGLLFPPLAIVGIVGLYSVRPRKRQSAPGETEGRPAKGEQPQS